MDPVTNPFRPGAGRRPPWLAGREAFLDAFTVVGRRCEEYGEGDRGWILSGLRGVGKTALLNEMVQQAVSAKWIVAKVEAGGSRSLARHLSQALALALRTATGIHRHGTLRRAAEAFKAFQLKIDPDGAVSVGVKVDLPLHPSRSDLSVDLADLFTELGETARGLGIGVLVAVDELQESDPAELAALNAAMHALGQQPVPVPVILLGAGLPSLPAVLSDASSYAERLYDYRPVGLLDRAASAQALQEPSREQNVAWRGNALAAALKQAGGYPYFLQACGKHIWDAAIRSPITLDDVQAGLALARAEVDDGLYRSRWERATPRQRDLLHAMADLSASRDNGTVPIGELATAMGKRRVSDLSVARNEVLRKGLVYAPERGLLAFTVPGMDRFIREQP